MISWVKCQRDEFVERKVCLIGLLEKEPKMIDESEQSRKSEFNSKPFSVNLNGESFIMQLSDFRRQLLAKHSA